MKAWYEFCNRRIEGGKNAAITDFVDFKLSVDLAEVLIYRYRRDRGLQADDAEEFLVDRYLPPSVRREVKRLSELLLLCLGHFSDILIF